MIFHKFPKSSYYLERTSHIFLRHASYLYQHYRLDQNCYCWKENVGYWFLQEISSYCLMQQGLIILLFLCFFYSKLVSRKNALNIAWKRGYFPYFCVLVRVLIVNSMFIRCAFLCFLARFNISKRFYGLCLWAPE